MRLKKTVGSGVSVTRLLGVALLASTAAACSSDANRFAYKNPDQLYTASVPQPSSASLAPLASVGGNPVPPGGIGGPYAQQPGGFPQAAAYPQANPYPQNNAYPQYNGFPQAPAPAQQPYPGAQAGVSQAFPGDYRAPVQSGYDPTATGSVPGAVARASASPASLIPAQVQRAEVMQPALAAPSSKLPNPAKASQIPHVTAPAPAPQRPAVAMPAAAPLAQPFPERPQNLTASVQPASIYNQDADQVLAPDPIVTGSAPKDAGWTTVGATRITLGAGETIYNLSKRYGVPASEIMKANDIADASKVSAGRQLLIPVYVYSRQAPVSAPDNNPKTRAANSGAGLRGEARHDRIPIPVPSPGRDVAVLPSAPSLRTPQKTAAVVATAAPVTTPAAAPVPVANTAGVYAVKGGDTLTKIARNHGVSVDALKAANDLSGSNIRIGQTLAIPGTDAGALDETRTASVSRDPAPKPYTPPASPAQAKGGASQDGVAAKTRADTASIAPASTGIDKFRWPARGQVITAFAQNEDGKRNDGIDISMPTGTPIKAAENGVVIYSGDGLKEYGKTVLIRHDDGLVTVYAHANDLHVKRGDKIARGQVIASSGMTGVAKTPRLHFEVRKNASPVDPMGYLE